MLNQTVHFHLFSKHTAFYISLKAGILTSISQPGFHGMYNQFTVTLNFKSNSLNMLSTANYIRNVDQLKK